jgi:D-3-phosphoglycerate dehydrogenase
VWRVLVTDGLEASGLALLREAAEVIESSTLERLPESDALVVRSRTKVTGEVIRASGERLKVVGRAGVGVDNIDLESARARGLTVVNAPEAPTAAVAELTLGLMLALARQIPQADAGMRRGEWNKSDLHGSELSGKTLGILGVGRIGAAVASRAAAFGMRVLGHDPLIAADQIVRRGADPRSFDELLRESDYLCLHLPLNDDTRGLIGPAALQVIKPGARLISAARGGIVDEAAALEALEDGRLAGVALDVYAEEPPGALPLRGHPNVVLTPHIGAQTREAQSKAATDIAAEVVAALRGEPLRWRVV